MLIIHLNHIVIRSFKWWRLYVLRLYHRIPIMSGRRAQSLPPHMLEPAKPERGRCVTAICFSWKVITCIVSHVTLVLLVVAYCVGGAYLFQRLEKPHEKEVKKDIHRMRLNLTEKIWTHSDNLTFLSEETWIKEVKDDLQLFEKQILTAMKTHGWDGNEDLDESQWTFAGSLFYSIIVITTIGYGHISPRTDWGKVTTIFYAIVGIPLMLLCLSNIGDVMATSFRFIYWRVCCYVCTRTSKQTRNRSRQRSARGHRYSSRSQPPPLRRSIKRPGGHGGGLQHAYSDPELRTAVRNDYDRNFEHDRNDRRIHRSEARGGSDRRRDHREHSMMMAPPSTRGSSRQLPPYEEHYYLPDEEPSYTQTLNRGARFSSRQRNRDRMHDRHTVERERHIGRSKPHFDSMEDLQDLPPAKRAMSVRSVRTPNIRRDEISRESRESRELNRLNSQQGNMLRGKSMPNNNGRARAKSVDPRLSAAHFEDVDEEVVRKTPIISNRYAITEMEHRESRSKHYLRSQSMPRSAFHKNGLNNYHSTRQYQDDTPNHVNNQHSSRQHSGYANTNHQSRRASLGRHTSLGPPPTNSRFGNRLELPEFSSSHGHRMKRGVSPRRYDIYEEDYDDTFHEDPEEHIHMDRRGRGGARDYEDDYSSRRSSSHRKRSPRKEKPERLPPSPRIMSPMGFAVKRQVRRRPSFDYDNDSQYGDEWNDYYGDILPKDRPVPIWLCVFLVISYILAGAALFSYWENWSFLDAAYFCFITLTTIGFGDFVPAKGVQEESEQSIAYCSLYLLFGIALLAMSFNLVQEEFIANVKEVGRRLGILKDEDDEED